MKKNSPEIEQLKSELDYYKTIADYSYDWEILHVDNDFKYVSPACETITGYEPEEFINNIDFFFKIVLPEDLALVKKHFIESQECNTHEPLDFRIRTKSGQVKWIGHYCHKAYNSKGECIGNRSSNRDITKARLRAIAIKESELLYHQLYDYSPVSVLLADDSGNIVKANPKAAEFFGHSQEELSQMTIKEITHPDDADDSYDLLKQLKNKEIESFRTEKKYIHKSGKIIWGEVSVSAAWDENGEFRFFIGHSIDIGSRKEIEAKLKESEGNFRLLFENMNEAFALHEVITDDKGEPINYRFIEVNNMCEKLTGLKRENLIGKTVLEVLPETEDYWIKKFGSVALSMQPLDFTNYSKDLDRYYATRSFSPQKGFFAVVFSDVTEKMKMEEALKLNEERLKEAQKIANVGHWEFDLVNNHLKWSDEVFRIFELNPENTEASFEIFMETIHPDDREMVNNTYKRSVEEKIEYKVEHRLKLKSGLIKYVEESGTTKYGENGEPILTVGVVKDISQQKKIEQVLDSSLHLNDLLKSHSENEIIDYGLEESVRLTDSTIGFFHFVNEDQETISLTTWSKGTKEMCDVPELVTHYPIKEAGTWVDSFHTKKAVIHNDYHNLKHKKGLPQGHFPLNRYVTVPVLDGDKVVSIFGVGNKITDYTHIDVDLLNIYADNIWKVIKRKRLEDELRETIQVKDRFFSIISHDLRSPFNGLLGLSDLLYEQVKAKNLENIDMFSEEIYKSSNKTYKLVENLLTWARIQTNKIETDKTIFKLLYLVKEAENQLTAALDEKKIKFIVDVDSSIELFADFNMIQTVIRNLVSNAVKFSNVNGEVSISANVKDGKTICSVTDKGIGMEAEFKDKLFILTEKTSRPGTNNETGTGLGLILCKEFVENHGGDIWIESELGKGSKFSFSIPNS